MSIRSSVENNLRNLKLESLHLVDFRVGGLRTRPRAQLPMSAFSRMSKADALRPSFAA